MNNNINYKKYTIQAKTGIKGEYFFGSLVSDYCIPHKINGSKDLGLDYICEWVYNDRPTGVLFAVQVKTFSEETAKPKLLEEFDKYNHLKKYEIKNHNFNIDEKTLFYWKGFGIPIYLFAICLNSEGNMDCYYKRFTPILTKETDLGNINWQSDYYKINDGYKFLAFQNNGNKTLGFARDLFIDYTRCNYFKGSITYLNPRDIGLNQFPEENIFPDLFKEYEKEIILTYTKTKTYLDSLLEENNK